jgi:threonine/homoserine/homoserine lactone efflux protein
LSTSLGADVLAFAIVAATLTIIPGLDTALVLRAAVTHGRSDAFATALGVNSGVLVWGVGAAAGVSALLTASTAAYVVLRFVGAAYMVILGSRFLRDAWRPRQGRLPHSGSGGDARRSPSGVAVAWRRGFITNLANPKVGAFYVALLPQFIPRGSPHILVGLMLASVHNVEGIAWFSLLILGIHGGRSWIMRPRIQRTLNAITGAVLITFASTLVLSDNN